MNRIFALAMGLALFTTANWGPTAHADAKVGQAAPAFELKDLDGKLHSLASLQGKTVVLEWLNFDCPFVKKHYDSGNLQKLQADAAKEGVIWLSIASSAEGQEGYYAAPTLQKMAAAKKSQAAAILLDTSGAVGKAYGAKVTPHMYVIDGTGRLAYNGAIDSMPTTKVEDVKTAVPYVVQALAALKKGEPVKTAATRAYGCGVKYK